VSVRCCAVSTRTGKPCGRYAIEGGTVCPAHGGSAPQVRQKAAARVLETRLAGELTREPINPIVNPVLAVQELAGESMAWLAICRRQIARLSNVDYSDARGGQDVKPVIQLYERAMASAQRVTTDMVRLGIEAKMAGQVDRQASEIIGLVRTAVEVAREHPEMSADAILLQLIGAPGGLS
jgi:hypothetical protein